jgi:hypothetical protein
LRVIPHGKGRIAFRWKNPSKKDSQKAGIGPKLHTEFAYRVKSWPMPKNNTGESNQSGLYRQWLRSGCQAFA